MKIVFHTTQILIDLFTFRPIKIPWACYCHPITVFTSLIFRRWPRWLKATSSYTVLAQIFPKRMEYNRHVVNCYIYLDIYLSFGSLVVLLRRTYWWCWWQLSTQVINRLADCTVTVQCIVFRIRNQALALLCSLWKNWQQSPSAERDVLGCGCLWYFVRHFCIILWCHYAEYTIS